MLLSVYVRYEFLNFTIVKYEKLYISIEHVRNMNIQLSIKSLSIKSLCFAHILELYIITMERE